MSVTQTGARNGRITLDPSGAERIAKAIGSGELDEIEILWPDHQGHARGKRIEARGFLDRAARRGFAFCDAALTWDVEGDIKEGLRLSGWGTGYPTSTRSPTSRHTRRCPGAPARARSCATSSTTTGS